MKLQMTLLIILMIFPLAQIAVIYHFISSVLPEAVAGSSLHAAMTLSLYIMILILVMSVIASIVGGRLILNPVSKLMNGMKKIRRGDLKARIDYTGKNEIGELAAAFNSLMDTIEEKTTYMSKSLDELTQRESQYQFALSVTKDLVFKIDIATGAVSSDSFKWMEFFGREVPKTIAEAFDLAADIVHPEDWMEFKQAFAPEMIRSRFRSGNFSETREVRLLNRDGKYIWTQNVMQLIDDKDHRCVFGRVSDIDAIKRKQIDIISESQKDGLTGLLRKNVTEKLISDYLNGDGKNGEHGMLIIDIDDFKMINDTAGHLYGDAVLTELSKRIERLFRNTDIVGRIGGDEFLILLKNIKYNNLIIEKADALIDIFDIVSATMQLDAKISASIGIVKYPEDGTTYKELFSKADKALYGVKDKGKHAYSFYSEVNEREKFLSGIKKEDYFTQRKQDDPILIKTAKHSKESITQDIFQILYESKDMNKSINLIMEIIGRFYDVSRVYIFELSVDKKTYSYNYEWCNEGIIPDIDSFKVTRVEGLGSYMNNFNQDGIFYCEDTTKLPDTVYKGQETNRVYSLLECAILDKGKFAGFTGFEECSDKRFWVKDEIDTLVLVARILAIVLVQERKDY